jgi:hypothetical protein
MGVKGVKKKVPLSVIFPSVALLTFLVSWADLFPREFIETAYSRRVFPTISHVFGVVSGALTISWLDIWILVSIAILIYVVSRRRWRVLIPIVSLAYLWFFWGWGLNYHRLPLAKRLHLDSSALTSDDFQRFGEIAAEEINRLWSLSTNLPPLDRETASTLSVRRVNRVISQIDGTDWKTDTRVKRSVLAQIWYQSAGIDGMFNPFGHEPLVIEGPLAFELPFLMCHEIAHVRGVANEGEANLVALLATVASDDPRFQYSGWLYLWEYLRIPSSRLDPGPRADLKAARDRVLRHQIRFVSQFQTSLLDVHLKANAVPGGIQSYSDFVALAIASRPRWQDFQ